MTQARASRIQSSTAKQNGGYVSSDSFAARAQSAAARNANEQASSANADRQQQVPPLAELLFGGEGSAPAVTRGARQPALPPLVSLLFRGE
jgi:hypothetical protein